MSKKILINNHLSLLSANDINEICKPLRRLSITHFTYIKNFRDGSQVYLSNSARWIDDYYTLALFETSLFESDPNAYQSGYYIWSNEENSEVFIHGRDYFDSGNGITIIQRNEDNCEFYFFSGSVKDTWLGNFYLNNIDLLEKFILYFKDSANLLLKKAEKNRIIYPKNSNIKELKVNVIDSDLTKLRTDFLRDINADEPIQHVDTANLLSTREKEVALNILQGRTANETSTHLFISRKTVERHLENIRKKLGCQNKTELIKRLLVLEKLQTHFLK